MKIRYAYSDFDADSDSYGLACLDDSRTIQSGKEEADINTIVKRFGITGKLPENVRVPTYGDFTDVIDFKSAHLAMIEADRSFMQMPADVRERFANDPQRFVEFCSDEKNIDEMRKLGLAVPAPVVDTPPVVVPPVA